jgi:sialate O-acetylesterase
MNRKTLARLAMLGAASALLQTACADVVPASLFSSHMVLQRDKPLPVWGRADAGEAVTVEFAGQSVSTKADAAGRWLAELKPLALNKDGASLVLKGKNTVVLENILVGDVWLCSGQSNMEMSFSWGILGGEAVMAEAGAYPLIRQVKVARKMSLKPLEEVDCGKWVVCSSNTLKNVTAAGYYFALTLNKELGIPVGLLDDNWSGCKIEPFTAPEGFAAVSEMKDITEAFKKYDLAAPEGRKLQQNYAVALRAWFAAAETKLNSGLLPDADPPTVPGIMDISSKPAAQYNAMIAPLVRFPIKGAIWYQGCSNGGDGDFYYFRMKALIEGWRKVWNDDFPFYFVQLASYTPATQDPAGGNGYAKIREAQRRALDIPKTGMAVAIDIGDPVDIHPKNKQDVGRRLALWALKQDYGKPVVCSGPLFKEQKIEGGTIRISFDHTGSGLMVGSKKGLAPTAKVADGTLNNFAIAGKDQNWFWADAVIDGTTVVVSSTNVLAPVAVRYAYRAFPTDPNLYNQEGLPASPFRTDTW